MMKKKSILTGVILTGVIGAALYMGLNLYEQTFYDPNRGYTKENGQSEQFFVDMSAFSELHFPGYTTSSAKAEKISFGKYDLMIRQGSMFAKEEEVFTGQLVRGNLQFEGEDFYKQAPANAFYDKGPHSYMQKQDQGSYDYTIEELERLPKTCVVDAYVGFKDEISMEQLVELQKKYEDLYFGWVAITVNEKERHFEHTGFEPTGTGRVLEEGVVPEEQFPYFELAHVPRENGAISPEILEGHFKTLLKYMATRKGFLEHLCTINHFDVALYQEMLGYVEANGVKSYGVVVQGAVDSILAFMKDENTETIMVEDVKISWLSS